MNTPEQDRLLREAEAANAKRISIARKGLRLQIATEIFASVYAGVAETAGLPDNTGVAASNSRQFALKQADALITENEAMP